jgi:uncharacterized membrane protein YjgN (DUF898 family)
MSSNYLGAHTGYGSAKFHTDAPVPALYGNFGMTVLFVLAAGLVCGLIGLAAGGGIAAFVPFISAEVSEELDPATLFAMIPLFATILGIYVSIFLAYIFYAAGVRNIAYNGTRLDGQHRLQSTLGRLRYTWILVSNLFAALFTLMLLRPWAVVRTWRYLAANTSVLIAGSLDEIVESAAPDGNVAAAEFLDIEGIDFGL